MHHMNSTGGIRVARNGRFLLLDTLVDKNCDYLRLEGILAHLHRIPGKELLLF